MFVLKVFFEIEIGVVIKSFRATDLGLIRDAGTNRHRGVRRGIHSFQNLLDLLISDLAFSPPTNFYCCHLTLLGQYNNTIFNIASFCRIDKSNSSYYL